jgi:hypothetical protein
VDSQGRFTGAETAGKPTRYLFRIPSRGFEAAFGVFFNIQAKLPIQATTRILYLMEKK